MIDHTERSKAIDLGHSTVASGQFRTNGSVASGGVSLGSRTTRRQRVEENCRRALIELCDY
jgi:hypothetical protein